MLAWISKLLADPAGLPDDGRVAAMLLVLGYLGLSGWNVIALHHAFDMQQFGVGAGALSAGVGGWFGFRKGN